MGSNDGLDYGFSYTVAGSEEAGTWKLTVDLVDLAGNSAAVDLGMVTLTL